MSRKKKKKSANYNPQVLAEKKAIKKAAKEARENKQRIIAVCITSAVFIAGVLGIYFYFKEKPKDIFDSIQKIETIDLSQ